MWDFDQRKYIDSQGFASFEDSGVLNATLEDIVERIKTLESFASEAPDRFLRKDTEDTTSHLTTFEKGLYSDIIRSRNFGSGMAGSGFQIKHDENGSHLEVDFATFRKKAYFHELVIQQISHQGGILFFSPARMECSEVQITADGFKCFFDTKSGTVSNDFVVGDQARCQRFQLGLTTAKYYWRLVTEVGSDYIVLSLNDADLGSDQPEAGDLIVALGNRTEKERQAAKITTVIGFNAPRDEYYEGIDSYDLTGRLVTVVGVNEGKVGVFTEHGTFSGSVVIGANSAGLENLAEWADKQSQINQAHATASEAALLAQQSASALKALEKTLEGINDDSVLSVSEKFSLRTEWEKINGLASLRSNGSSGSYRSTLKMIDELGYKQGENILLSYGDFVLTYNGIRIVYNQTGVENFNLAYEALKEYFVSVRLYQNEPAQNFDRQEAAKLLTAYYDTQSELLSLAQKYHALTASSQALENFVNTTYKENIEELRKSIDGKSQTHRQPEDPSVLWTDEESKATHENDIWWNTSEQTINGVPAGATAIYTKSGDSYIWELAPVPKEVFDSIDGKAEIFVSKPTAYNKNDVWILESDEVMTGHKAGTMLFATTASDTFDANHWKDRVRYTDDTAAEAARALAAAAAEAAQAAQNAANNAQTKADNAAKTLSDWSSDKIISPVEKSGVSDERAFIIADKTDIDNQRSRYAISATNSVYTAYVSGYNTYKADLDTILGASGSVAVPEGMAEHQATFYNARTAILNAIAAAAKLVADNAQEAADDAQEAADAAKERADAAYAYAEGLKDLLEQIDDDTILNISEKRSIRTQWEMISGAASLFATGPNGSYPKAVEIAEDLGLEAGQKSLLVFNGYKIAYNGTIIQYYVSGFAALTSAYEHLRDYLSSIRLYQDDSTEQFNRQEFASRITAYYAAEASFMAAAQAAYTDKKTDETKQLVTDLEYLAAAFKNSLEVNGVVMSEMVAVKANNVIKAFLNGSAFGSSTEHGVLFLAGGIPSRAASGSTNLEDRAREAKTRAFDDGSFYSEKATFKQAIITNETSYTVIDDSTTRNPPDRSEYHIDGSAYRNFDIHFKGCSLWDVEEEGPTYGGLYPTSASQVEDFTLVVDNMAVGVIYTAILAFEHIGGQEYNHGGLHAGYDYENGIYGILKISISETAGGAHYDNRTFIRAWDVENNNIYNPYMCARLECHNGQRCSIQFMKTQSGDIRVVSFSSDFIKTCVEFT